MANKQINLPQEEHQAPTGPDLSAFGLQSPESDNQSSFNESLRAYGIDPDQLEKSAEACLAGIRWPDGVRCPIPGCDSYDCQEVASRKPMPYRCRSCRKYFSVTSRTMLRSGKLGCLKLVVAICLLAAHRKSSITSHLAGYLEIDEKTAKRLQEQFQTAVDDPSLNLPSESRKADQPHADVGGPGEHIHEEQKGTEVAASNVDPDVPFRFSAESLDSLMVAQLVLGVLLIADQRPMGGEAPIRGLPVSETGAEEFIDDKAPNENTEQPWQDILRLLGAFRGPSPAFGHSPAVAAEQVRIQEAMVESTDSNQTAKGATGSQPSTSRSLSGSESEKRPGTAEAENHDPETGAWQLPLPLRPPHRREPVWVTFTNVRAAPKKRAKPRQRRRSATTPSSVNPLQKPLPTS